MSFSLCLCRRKRELASFLLSYSSHCSVCLSHCVFAEERESWLLSCCRIVAIVPCVFLIVSLQKKERPGFFLAAVKSPLFRVSFSLCLCRRKRELVSFLLSYSRHCSVCLSHCVFAEERESWFLSCCRIVAIVPCVFLIVSLQKKERPGFFLAVV